MNTQTFDRPAIQVRGLRRTYGSGPTAFEAVRGLDLEVAPGTVTALLGVNGAGKTSTLEVIEGLAPATGGEVRVLGLDPVADRAAVRRRTGVLLQSSGFSGDLTVRETLQMWAGLVSDPRPLDESLAMLDLTARADVRVLALSGGERRRLDLTSTLLGRPEVVMLDEPTTGMDPESRRNVWRLLEDLRDQGTTILLTTHYLEEAEVLAEHISIMAAGRIVRSGTPAELATGHPSTITFATPDAGSPFLPGLAGPAVVEGGQTRLETHDLQASLTDLLAWAQERGVRLEELNARTASLESIFLAIADEASRGETAPSTHLDPSPVNQSLEGATR